MRRGGPGRGRGAGGKGGIRWYTLRDQIRRRGKADPPLGLVGTRVAIQEGARVEWGDGRGILRAGDWAGGDRLPLCTVLDTPTRRCYPRGTWRGDGVAIQGRRASLEFAQRDASSAAG